MHAERRQRMLCSRLQAYCVVHTLRTSRNLWRGVVRRMPRPIFPTVSARRKLFNLYMFCSRRPTEGEALVGSPEEVLEQALPWHAASRTLPGSCTAPVIVLKVEEKTTASYRGACTGPSKHVTRARVPWSGADHSGRRSWLKQTGYHCPDWSLRIAHTSSMVMHWKQRNTARKWRIQVVILLY
jgi:hypothetical protein